MSTTRATPSKEARRRFGWVEAAVAGTLVLLLYHMWMYWFLTDDAFISFRYARNLSDGYGLVFNPGFERVEGYSNFLWVLLLSLGNTLGIRPEWAANPLSVAATVGLWALVVWFVYRSPPAAGRRWLLLVAPLFLAATRSVAVWSTGGLETRLFELLVLAGALRLVAEIEATMAGRTCRGFAGLFFALATLTRPDGLLVSAASLGTAGVYLLIKRRLTARRAAEWLVPYVLLVGGHFAFRLAYYGYWFPNTYYAKVSGQTWWDMGTAYLGLCALEHAAYLWIPLLIAGVCGRCREGGGHVPLLFGAIVLPHMLYVAAIGGDHFEFRPLDLYFPFIFILLYDGARALARGVTAAWLTAVYLVIMLIGLTDIGWQSHRQYPDRYCAGFPGQTNAWTEMISFLAPEHDPIYRLPGLDRIARLHKTLLKKTTRQYVGVRQEEHRFVCEAALERGRLHRKFIEAGMIPADAYVVLTTVGAVPYVSNLRVLDYLGLTDAVVAHSPRRPGERVMAHDKRENFEYIQRSGADFLAWQGESCLLHVADPLWPEVIDNCLRSRQRFPSGAAKVGEGYYLVGFLPQGLDQSRVRFSKLDLIPLSDRTAAFALLRTVADEYRRLIAEGRADYRVRLALANAFMILGEDVQEALVNAREAARERPDDADALGKLAFVEAVCGNRETSRVAAERAIAIAKEQGESAFAETVRRRINDCWRKVWGVPAFP